MQWGIRTAAYQAAPADVVAGAIVHDVHSAPVSCFPPATETTSDVAQSAQETSGAGYAEGVRLILRQLKPPGESFNNGDYTKTRSRNCRPSIKLITRQPLQQKPATGFCQQRVIHLIPWQMHLWIRQVINLGPHVKNLKT